MIKRLNRRVQDINPLHEIIVVAFASPTEAHVTALVESSGWIEQGANLLLFVPPGVGKKHLVCAIANGLIDRGYRVHLTRMSDLVQRLQVSRREIRCKRLPSNVCTA